MAEQTAGPARHDSVRVDEVARLLALDSPNSVLSAAIDAAATLMELDGVPPKSSREELLARAIRSLKRAHDTTVEKKSPRSP